MSVSPGDRARKMRLGLWVLAGLIAIDVVEYLVGVSLKHALIPLAILTIPAAWLIARYFMHIDRLRKGRE